MSSARGLIGQTENTVRWDADDQVFRLTKRLPKRGYYDSLLYSDHQNFLWLAHTVFELDLFETLVINKMMPRNLKFPKEWTLEFLRQVMFIIARMMEHYKTPYWEGVARRNPIVEQQIMDFQRPIYDENISYFETDKITTTLRLMTKSGSVDIPQEQLTFIYHAWTYEKCPKEAIGNSLLAQGFVAAKEIHTRMYPEIVRYMYEESQRSSNQREWIRWARIFSLDKDTNSKLRDYIRNEDRGAQPPQPGLHGDDTTTRSPPKDSRGNPKSSIYAPKPPEQVAAGFQHGATGDPFAFVPGPPPQGSTGYNQGAPVGQYDPVPIPSRGVPHGAGFPGQPHPGVSMLPVPGQRLVPEGTSNYQGYAGPPKRPGPMRTAELSGMSSTPEYTQYKEQRGTSRAPGGVAMTARASAQAQRAVKSSSALTRPPLLADASGRASSLHSNLRGFETEKKKQELFTGQQHEYEKMRLVQTRYEEEDEEYWMQMEGPTQATSGYTVRRAGRPWDTGIMDSNWGGDRQGLLQPQAQQQDIGASDRSRRSSPALERSSRYSPQPGSGTSSPRLGRRSQTPAEEYQSQSSRGSSPVPRHQGAGSPLKHGIMAHNEAQERTFNPKKPAERQPSQESRGSSPVPRHQGPGSPLRRGIIARNEAQEVKLQPKTPRREERRPRRR